MQTLLYGQTDACGTVKKSFIRNKVKKKSNNTLTLFNYERKKIYWNGSLIYIKWILFQN